MKVVSNYNNNNNNNDDDDDDGDGEKEKRIYLQNHEVTAFILLFFFSCSPSRY